MSDSNAFARVVHVLPAGETAASYVARCEHAARSFIDGASTWGKRELADWLTLDYRPAVFDLEPVRRNHGVMPMTATRRLTRGPLGEDDVREMLQRTLAELDDVLVAPEIAIANARQHLDVIQSIDSHGDEVFLAISRSKMKLSRRVLSLVAATGDWMETPRNSGAFLVKSERGVVRATTYAWVSNGR